MDKFLSKKNDHWIWSNFGTVANIEAGNPAPQGDIYFNGGNYPFVRVQDMGRLNGEMRLRKTKDTVNAKGKEQLKLFPKGSVLFTKSGASTLLNQRAILGQDSYIVSHIGIAMPKDGVLSEWLFYWLKLVDFADYAHGANMPSMPLSKAKLISTPLPPLNEQKRIVAKIEELFSELDKGIESLKTAREQLKVYRQAVLKHAFEGKLTADWREANKDKLKTADQLLDRIKQEREAHYQQQLKEWESAIKKWEQNGKDGKKPAKPKKLSSVEISSESKLQKLPYGWCWVSFGDSSDWTGGGTPSKSRSEFWENGDILWVSPKDMKTRKIKDTLQKVTKTGVDNSSAKLIKYLSILFVVRSGILRRILPIAIAPANITVNQDMQAIMPYFHDIDFLYWYSFANDYQIREQCSKDGTTVESIEVYELKKFPCPVASIEEQKEIVNLIELKMSVIDELEVTIDVEIKKSESLRQSILKKAFSGMLVEQDPNDEPASVLLERIKAEKAKLVKTTKKKRKNAA